MAYWRIAVRGAAGLALIGILFSGTVCKPAHRSCRAICVLYSWRRPGRTVVFSRMQSL